MNSRILVFITATIVIVFVNVNGDGPDENQISECIHQLEKIDFNFNENKTEAFTHVYENKIILARLNRTYYKTTEYLRIYHEHLVKEAIDIHQKYNIIQDPNTWCWIDNWNNAIALEICINELFIDGFRDTGIDALTVAICDAYKYKKFTTMGRVYYSYIEEAIVPWIIYTNIQSPLDYCNKRPSPPHEFPKDLSGNNIYPNHHYPLSQLLEYQMNANDDENLNWQSECYRQLNEFKFNFQGSKTEAFRHACENVSIIDRNPDSIKIYGILFLYLDHLLAIANMITNQFNLISDPVNWCFSYHQEDNSGFMTCMADLSEEGFNATVYDALYVTINRIIKIRRMKPMGRVYYSMVVEALVPWIIHTDAQSPSDFCFGTASPPLQFPVDQNGNTVYPNQRAYYMLQFSSQNQSQHPTNNANQASTSNTRQTRNFDLNNPPAEDKDDSRDK